MTAPQPASEALQSILQTCVEEMLPSGASAPRVQVDRSKAGFSSDFQTPAALQLAKVLKRPPRQIAADLVERLQERLGGLTGPPDISGPGFIGFRLSDDALQGYLASLLASETYGVAQDGDGSHVVIDYSSPNVAKRMHVGHIRSTVIGDALARMGRALGYRVIGDNHIGDWGTQFGQIIYAWDHWLEVDAYAQDPVGELERLYVKFQGLAKVDPETASAEDIAQASALNDASRAELAKLQAGDERNVGLWRKFLDDSRHVFDAVYARLGVEFDVTYGESHYRDALVPLVDRLLADGVAEPSEGAVCVFFRDAEGEDERPPFLIRKKDGAALYGTTDIATVEFRMKTWSPARIIYVTDHRQRLHFEQLFATVQRMGVEAELQHVMFGIMTSPEGALSTRSGNAIPLDQLLDEAERRARALLSERMGDGGADFDDAELGELARMLGLGAIKYSDLSNNPASNITFTWDKMLSFEGNTAPYLQYTSARTHSLLRKAAAAGLEPDGTTLALRHDSERALLLHLANFGPTLRAAFDAGKPNTLASWLYDLASRYHGWYAACPVMKADEPQVRLSRLNLTLLTERLLVHGLGLLGIGSPERM